MSDLELQQLFDNTFDCYTYYEDDSMEEVKEPAMTKATFVAEVFKLLRKQANDAQTENSKCAIPVVSFSTADSALNMSTEERERRSAEQRHLLRGSRAEVCHNKNKALCEGNDNPKYCKGCLDYH